ncbi:glycosyltransferase family 2 protein [bacterium]|nr:glycosyltransferase family 2 protein [bacterium]
MISILCPTRHRPQNIERMWQSIQDTAKNPKQIEVVIYIDADDDSYDNLKIPVVKIKGERIVLSDTWNKCAQKAKHDILMYAGDDIIFKTPNWDEIVIETFNAVPDKVLFVFGNDGSVHDGIYGTHGFVHRTWFNTLGYICPPLFSGDYSDTWINDVAKLVGRHKHIKILTEHLHPDFKKSELDDTYLEKYERMKKDKTAELYFSLTNERQQDANKLKEIMK